MNIGEIARRAGVSRSTVSYVLSGKRQVSPDLHRRVTEVIEAAGYRPSATARALAEGTTRTIGLAIPPVAGHLSVDQLHFVGAVSEAAADAGYDVLLSPSGAERRAAFDRIVEQRRVDGMILMETVLHDSRVAKLAAEDFPFVTIGRTGDSDTHGWVDLDYAGLVAQGIEQLAAAGHRRVALINRQQDLLDHEYGPAYRAADAFGKAVVELNLDGHAECCDDDNAAAAACLDRIFAAMPDVTALLTINERSLTGVVTSLLGRDLRIPTDISVLAIASERNATSVTPMVSAADVPTAAMGAEAVAAVLRRISNPEGSLPNHLFSPPFVDRGSVAAPRR
ncbi:LacI family DNA-binding transcriptional regulator [Kribbella albertanoniae]|uniref:LacI family transcriptional regulator n=1 Tax=Kribbella albertanoniae TaxID=1266829 RepID=A0A4R4PAE0_9ACTN|nr:LacI family DNA-binding transcriptional regulator [Kribbella albertanoniae]TDC17917.1 LacI family transcriptional regulator [Kribbella albertanoniae]